jgi:hypothetical protein
VRLKVSRIRFLDEGEGEKNTGGGTVGWGRITWKQEFC